MRSEKREKVGLGMFDFFRDIQSVYLKAFGSLRFVYAVNPAGILSLGELYTHCSNNAKAGVAIYKIQESSNSKNECFTRAWSRLDLNIANMQRFRFSFTKHFTKKKKNV